MGVTKAMRRGAERGMRMRWMGGEGRCGDESAGTWCGAGKDGCKIR